MAKEQVTFRASDDLVNALDAETERQDKETQRVKPGAKTVNRTDVIVPILTKALIKKTKR